VGDDLVGALIEEEQECHGVLCHPWVTVAVAEEAFVYTVGEGVVVQHVSGWW
jgi:hypothetical protein